MPSTTSLTNRQLSLQVRRYEQSGDMAHEYNPLKNIKDSSNALTFFTTNEITCDLGHPVEIQCQPSYDGTVNLIINDDFNPPRLVNTRFSVTENNTYRIVNRNQDVQTNIYHTGAIDAETRLFKNVRSFPVIDLLNVDYAGQLTGGTYVFYIKYRDDDQNETDVVSESGIVEVFKGSFNDISSISGTIADEITDKSINLQISKIDTTYYKFTLYFSRETCLVNGTRTTRYFKVNEPYEVAGETMQLSFNGYEQVTEITADDLNIQYNVVNRVKSSAQVQNRLFFANIEKDQADYPELQYLSYFIRVQLKQNNSGPAFCTPQFQSAYNSEIPEYYNPINTYYYLGYWPDEIYRIGIVYIYNDDTLSPVFNLRGVNFENVNDYNYDNSSPHNCL